MTEQTKTLSTQALNKITKALYAGDGYSSKTLDAFLKAKAEFEKARRAVRDEIEQVRGKIDEDEEKLRESRAFKKLEGDARWEAVEKFDNAGSELSNTLNLVGYNYEGYDVLSEAWQSSSMSC